MRSEDRFQIIRELLIAGKRDLLDDFLCRTTVARQLVKTDQAWVDQLTREFDKAMGLKVAARGRWRVTWGTKIMSLSLDEAPYNRSPVTLNMDMRLEPQMMPETEVEGRVWIEGRGLGPIITNRLLEGERFYKKVDESPPELPQKRVVEAVMPYIKRQIKIMDSILKDLEGTRMRYA
jgi:hypothetical protein